MSYAPSTRNSSIGSPGEALNQAALLGRAHMAIQAAALRRKLDNHVAIIQEVPLVIEDPYPAPTSTWSVNRKSYSREAEKLILSAEKRYEEFLEKKERLKNPITVDTYTDYIFKLGKERLDHQRDIKVKVKKEGNVSAPPGPEPKPVVDGITYNDMKWMDKFDTDFQKILQGDFRKGVWSEKVVNYSVT